MLTISALAGVGVLAVAGPALAHVEVSANKNTVGATDVTLTFNGEAENDAAGIKSERVVLPTGITPADVTLVKAPAGWKVTQNSDGFTVAGKALKIGTDAVWSVKIAKLPDGATTLDFKTLETYGNGEVDRWIELQQAGQDEPDHPAPQLKLKAGPSSAPASSEAAAVSPSAAAPATTTPTVTAPASSDSGSSTWWIWVIVAVLVVAAGVLFAVRRRRTGSDTPGS
jgi:uncharacterized protein YcnI